MRHRLNALASVAILSTAVSGVACGSSGPPLKFPPREPGCEIRTFPDAPSYETENIGPVRSSCDDSVSDAECLRTLKDAACKLGADTVWALNDAPVVELGKKKYSGRAAHQK